MAAKKTEVAEVLSISAPNLRIAKFILRGNAPYVQNKFSQKAREMMKGKQQAGSTAKGKRVRDPKDFQMLYQQAMHKATEGWYGMPAPAFRNGMISACRVVGFKMTHAKLAVFVVPDGFDADDGTPLVKIKKGEPKYYEAMTRNETGVADIRPRPMWDPGWELELKVRYDADMFTVGDVANLLSRMGMQVGIGEGRPDSKKSNGLGWGTFDVLNKEDAA